MLPVLSLDKLPALVPMMRGIQASLAADHANEPKLLLQSKNSQPNSSVQWRTFISTSS